MTLTDKVTKKIISKLIKGKDYRIEIVTLIDAEFLNYVIGFFKQIVEAKLKNHDLTLDWYKREFLNPSLKKDDLAINSGLNMKTISNMYNSATKEIVLEASHEHYDILFETINNLIEEGEDLSVTLTIKFRGVSVDLSVNESLIVINDSVYLVCFHSFLLILRFASINNTICCKTEFGEYRSDLD